MIRAYEDSYLPDAQASLADYFDYVINGCGIDPDMAGALFRVLGRVGAGRFSMALRLLVQGGAQPRSADGAARVVPPLP